MHQRIEQRVEMWLMEREVRPEPESKTRHRVGKVNRFVWMGLTAEHYCQILNIFLSTKTAVMEGHRAAMIFCHWLNAIFVWVTIFFYTLQMQLVSFLFISQERVVMDNMIWWMRQDLSAQVWQEMWMWPAHADLPTKRVTCSTLVPHFNMLSF